MSRQKRQSMAYSAFSSIIVMIAIVAMIIFNYWNFYLLIGVVLFAVIMGSLATRRVDARLKSRHRLL